MSIPTPLEAAPLIRDEDVLARASDLVQRAHRRQFWFLLIDDEHRQLPMLPIIEVRQRPDDLDARHLPDHLCGIVQETGAAELAVVFERPGRPELTASDRAWLRLITAGAEVHELRMRGPLLAHGRGVRWVAPDDLR